MMRIESFGLSSPDPNATDNKALEPFIRQFRMLEQFSERIESFTTTQQQLAHPLGEDCRFELHSSSNAEDLRGSKKMKRRFPSPNNETGLCVNSASASSSPARDRPGFATTGPGNTPSLRLTVSRELTPSCERSCKCKCHHHQSLRLPLSWWQWTGHFNLMWRNMSWWRPNCNLRSCKRNADSFLRLQYAFPPRMLATMISAWYSGSALSGPQTAFNMIQQVDSKVYELAYDGNLEELRSYYVEGRASINQCDPLTGLTALLVG